MPKRCGDLAGFTFKVTSELVDKYSTIIISRTKKFNFTALHTEKLKKEETKKVKWPDLEKDDGSFCGGRKFDHKGLNKLSYDDKFNHQEFRIDFYQGKNRKKSTGLPLKIESYPPQAPDPQSKGIPMETEFWVYDILPTTDPHTGATVYSSATFLPDASHPSLARDYWEKRPDSNTGKFSMEFKDGVFILTVKISLQTSAPVPPGKGLGMIFYYIKKRVEDFWNSNACGFNQWLYHRTECKREDKCDCSVVKDSKGEYVSAGCCKFPFKVKIEKGGAGDNVINIHYLNPLQRQAAISSLAGLNYWGAESVSPLVDASGSRVAVSTQDLFFPENRANTYAHEIGHMLGFPDQYPTGVVERGAMSATGPVAGANWPIDDSSIMGMAQTSAKKIHAGVSWFNEWLNDKLEEEVKLIDTK